jgi:hypothetical protein
VLGKVLQGGATIGGDNPVGASGNPQAGVSQGKPWVTQG